MLLFVLLVGLLFSVEPLPIKEKSPRIYLLMVEPACTSMLVR